MKSALNVAVWMPSTALENDGYGVSEMDIICLTEESRRNQTL